MGPRSAVASKGVGAGCCSPSGAHAGSNATFTEGVGSNAGISKGGGAAGGGMESTASSAWGAGCSGTTSTLGILLLDTGSRSSGIRRARAGREVIRGDRGMCFHTLTNIRSAFAACRRASGPAPAGLSAFKFG